MERLSWAVGLVGAASNRCASFNNAASGGAARCILCMDGSAADLGLAVMVDLAFLRICAEFGRELRDTGERVRGGRYISAPGASWQSPELLGHVKPRAAAKPDLEPMRSPGAPAAALLAPLSWAIPAAALVAMLSSGELLRCAKPMFLPATSKPTSAEGHLLGELDVGRGNGSGIPFSVGVPSRPWSGDGLRTASDLAAVRKTSGD